MASIDGNALWNLASVIRSSFPKAAKTQLTATVSEVDPDGTVWVTVEGSDEMTPVNGTVPATVGVGDSVTVSIQNGVMDMGGNTTSKAIGTREGDNITQSVTIVQQATEAARSVADEAQAVATATGQHFFADDTGIHVTEAEGDATTDHNILINSGGLLLRYAEAFIASLTASAVAFYDGSGNAASNITAQFGSALARIGKAAGWHTDVTSSGVEIFNGSTSRALFGSTARIGSTSGTNITIESNKLAFTASDGTESLVIKPEGVVIAASSSSTGRAEKAYGSRFTDTNNLSFITMTPATNVDADDKLYFTQEMELSLLFAKLILHGGKTYVQDGLQVTGGLLVGGGAEIYGGLALGTPLPIESGGTGITDFGTIVQSQISTAVSVDTATNKSITYVQLPAGTWFLTYGVRFATNSTGRREAVFGTTADTIDATWQRRGGEQTPATSGGATMLSGSYTHTTTGSSTLVYLTVYQSSGGALDVTGTLQAIKVG